MERKCSQCLALATSAEWTTFILSSILLRKRILSCNINGCLRWAKWLIQIVLSKLPLHAYTSSILDLHVDTDYGFVFTGDETCEQSPVDWLHLGQKK